MDSNKTTSATKAATSYLDESEKAKYEVGTPTTTICSISDDCLSGNHLYLNTKTDYHIHIGSLSLKNTDMINDHIKRCGSSV